MSQSTHPVCGAHGNTRNVVGSAIIRTSAPPSISGMPKPPPAVNTGNTLRCEVSLARSVVVIVQPLRMVRALSLAITVLPRRMPCWSANDRRTTSSRFSSISLSALAAASNCSSLHNPWRSTYVNCADRSFDDDIALLLTRRLVHLARRYHRPCVPQDGQPSSPWLKHTKGSGRTSMLRPATIAAVIALCAVPQIAWSQSKPEFVPFRGQSKGALYRPDSGPAPHVGIVVMHRTANYLTHPACRELSRRGFMMLCMTTRYENNEVQVDFEKLPLDVKNGVEFLRKQPGITKVLLFGHSGGGPLMSLYQAVAENGTSYCKGPNKLSECGGDLAGLPPADGIVFADPNPGNSVNTLRRINPAVANENNPPDGPSVADIDMFDPKNGYNPNGASNYSPEFQARYFKVQADRMNRLIDIAQSKLDRIKRKDYGYSDD